MPRNHIQTIDYEEHRTKHATFEHDHAVHLENALLSTTIFS